MILITKKKVITSNYFVSENNTFKHKINKEIQLLLPTSGTTGSLKFVMLTKKIYRRIPLTLSIILS